LLVERLGEGMSSAAIGVNPLMLAGLGCILLSCDD
jgi:hypothetical protein